MTAAFVLSISGGQCRFGRLSELLGGSESVGSGWDPFFPAVRAAGVRTRHRCLFESVDMSVIADHRPSPIGSEMVPGNGDARCGDDVDDIGTQNMRHCHSGTGEFGWHRIPVTTIGHQRLARDDPVGAHDRRIRSRRQRMQPLGGSDRPHRRPPVLRRPQPGVTAQAAEPVEACLGLFDGQIVGDCAPPPLRCSVIGLLHRAFAVASAGWADGDGDTVIFGDAGEAGRDAAGVGVADCRHPIEPPHAADAAEASADAVESVDDMGLGHVRGEDPAPFARAGQRSDEQMCHRAPSPGVGWVR
ncbi:hypothetical protein RhoFasSB10_05168 [Rhodococcus fascians]|nr:hypothetical protein [Rhodococcus fascians]